MMRKLIWMLTISMVLPAFPNAEGRTVNGEERLTFPEIDGMKIEYNYPVYTGEDLWDYINGASDGYMSYHFERLDIAEYIDGQGNTVKVEIYKHQKPEDAYGIYSTERSPDYHFVEIGTEGYAEDNLVYFVTGPYYIKIIAAPGTSVVQDELMKIAKIIGDFLVENPSPPPVLAMFPKDGKILHSERFVATNVLGHEFLSDFFMADYDMENQQFTLMIHKGASEENCLNMLQKYYNYTKEPMPAKTQNGLYTVNDKYNGTIYFFLKGNGLIGFMGLNDNALRDRLAKSIPEIK